MQSNNNFSFGLSVTFVNNGLEWVSSLLYLVLLVNKSFSCTEGILEEKHVKDVSNEGPKLSCMKILSCKISGQRSFGSDVEKC